MQTWRRLSPPSSKRRLFRLREEQVLSSMTQAFYVPEKAESGPSDSTSRPFAAPRKVRASLLSFCNILTKWYGPSNSEEVSGRLRCGAFRLKPEAKDIAESKEPASSRRNSHYLARNMSSRRESDLGGLSAPCCPSSRNPRHRKSNEPSSSTSSGKGSVAHLSTVLRFRIDNVAGRSQLRLRDRFSRLFYFLLNTEEHEEQGLRCPATAPGAAAV